LRDASPTRVYTLSLHDALPIYPGRQEACEPVRSRALEERFAVTPIGLCALNDLSLGNQQVLVEALRQFARFGVAEKDGVAGPDRSEEHTSELQSRENLVCRLLL